MTAGVGDGPPYAVVIVSFASSGLLAQQASSLELPGRGSVVVVDCYSDDDERERVRSIAREHDWDAVLLDANAGYGGGTNAGARVALAHGAEVLVALNPDASIGAEGLDLLVAAAAADPMVIASPRILTGSGEPWFVGADLYLDDGVPRGARARARFEGAAREAWATGACFAISASLWSRLGGFDEEYFLYWEDIDLSHRALAAGARLELVDAVAVHDAGGTQAAIRAGRAKSELYYYFNIRNRMLYAAKHLEAAQIRRWARSAPRTAYDVLLRGGRRQLASWRPWRSYLRGLRDGRRIARSRLRAGARAAPTSGSR